MTALISPPKTYAAKAHIGHFQAYLDRYRESFADPEGFWAKQALRLDWIKKWNRVKNTSFKGDVSIRWFEGGKLNACYNCVDRHLPKRAGQTAILWEGDNPDESRAITYGELHEQVCRMANVLKKHGVKKGDRVTLYLPMIPEAAYAMLACARIGAVHSVVFAGFSAEALKGRIEDCGSEIVITADEGRRAGKSIPLKANVDEALMALPSVRSVIVVCRNYSINRPSPWRGEGGRSPDGGDGGDNRTPPPPALRAPSPLQGEGRIKERDVWYHEEAATVSADCPAEEMDAEDPLFILYTSGSTGKPKGVLHTTGGYLLWVSLTHELTFDYHEGDIFWCTADVGWVTGHSYIVYGPLANGAITVMFEGVPTWPDHSRFWQVVDKHKVNILHTAPTAIRALMREGDEWVKKTSRKSLKLLGSVGEPINPEAWLWYWRVVGEERCPIVDTWWQTETGGNMIAPLPGAFDLKPGSATLPCFGVKPVILDTNGMVLEDACNGLLCIADSWPGQARTIWGDHERFRQTYFTQFPGYYFTGDGARRDEDGYYWITGRVDDVINVSGHRLGTAEIESALVGHPKVAEAAVVGFPHDIKGQGIYAYVTLVVGEDSGIALEKELVAWVRKEISAIATPDIIHFTPALPKTRSGKIMRRILRKIAEGELGNLGDISTLLNPEAVEALVKSRKKPT